MKEIKLANTDKVAIVDDEDRDLFRYRWRLHPRGYAQTTFPGYGDTYMHRVIMERMLARALSNTEYVDHINGDKLDNRRSNLRLASASQNNANRGPAANNKTGYRGVVKDNRKVGCYRAYCGHTYLGRFSDPKAAALAYNKAAILKYGPYAKLNDVD